MGHALMDKVSAHWADLPGNAFKVLLLMAKTAMDDDLVPVYWKGWEYLAVTGLGRHDWPADADDSDQARQSRRRGFETVRQALRDIKLAGAITVTTPGKRGKQAVYGLRLDAPNLWTTQSSRKETLRHDARKPCVLRNETLRMTQGKAGAEETRETRETRGETMSSSEAPHQGSARLRLIRAAVDAERAQRGNDKSSLDTEATDPPREEPSAWTTA